MRSVKRQKKEKTATLKALFSCFGALNQSRTDDLILTMDGESISASLDISAFQGLHFRLVPLKYHL